VGVGICCWVLESARAGSHIPAISRVTKMDNIRNRFGFIFEIISGFI
jgi:hypothetical protein